MGTTGDLGDRLQVFRQNLQVFRRIGYAREVVFSDNGLMIDVRVWHRGENWIVRTLAPGTERAIFPRDNDTVVFVFSDFIVNQSSVPDVPGYSERRLWPAAFPGFPKGAHLDKREPEEAGLYIQVAKDT